MKTFVAFFLFLCLVLFAGGAGIQTVENFADGHHWVSLVQGLLILVIAVAAIYGLMSFTQNSLQNRDNRKTQRRTYVDKGW